MKSSQKQLGWFAAALLFVALGSGGAFMMVMGALCTVRQSIACRRDLSGVSCELHRAFPGRIVLTDPVPSLRSATVVTRKGRPSYQVLLLNAELLGARVELPGIGELGRDAPRAQAELRAFLQSQAPRSPVIRLREPSYGLAAFLWLIGVVSCGIGVFVVWAQASYTRRATGVSEPKKRKVRYRRGRQ